MLPDNQVTRNAILAGLPSGDVQRLLERSQLAALPAGHTLKAPDENYSTVFFPATGVVSGVGALSSGHLVEVAAIGAEGLVGVGPVLGLRQSPIRFLVQISTTGYLIPTDVFMGLFAESHALRHLTLAHVGRLLTDLARSACCNRFHSHRERLARWLVVTRRKAGTPSLELTHDFIAQMVGGPRHAVTAALSYLDVAGAIQHRRGHIVIVDETRLLAAACECAESARLS